MRIKEVVAALERFAPLPLQEDYDNAGLQTGLTEAEVSRVLLCLDVTEEVVSEAAGRGCQLIVSHHPLLFRGLKRIADETQVQRCVRLLIERGIALYSAHTNLDNAPGGVNAMMAERLGLVQTRFLAPAPDGRSGSGLIGTLPQAEDATAFLHRVKETFRVERLCHNGVTARPVRTVALCGGAGEFLLDAAERAGADVFLTGEMGYHHYFGHDSLLIGVMGHYESEQFTTQLLRRVLAEALPQLTTLETQVNTNPIKYI